MITLYDANGRPLVSYAAHEQTHASGGSDAFQSTDVLEAIVKRFQESGGPTTLLTGPIPDGSIFTRNGTSLVGTSAVPFRLTNNTGGALATGDVVALSSTASSSVVLADTASTQKQLVVSLDAPANGAMGRFVNGGVATVNVTGAVTIGHYLVKSVTTKVAADSGTAVGDTQAPPSGSFGVALTTAASNQITALLFGVVLAAAASLETGTWSADLGPGGTAARAAATVYQNTSGRKRRVEIVININIAGTVAILYVENANPPTIQLAKFSPWANTSGGRATLVGEVPSNQYYKVDKVGTDTLAVFEWHEMDE